MGYFRPMPQWAWNRFKNGVIAILIQTNGTASETPYNGTDEIATATATIQSK
jgi:hypothetical protein